MAKKAKETRETIGDGRFQRAPMMKELPACERPREKLLRQGVSTLSNAELLSILIGSGARKRSAISVANQILSMEEAGIAYLSDCLPEELTAVPGVGEAKACQITAAIELGKRIAAAPRWDRIRPQGPGHLASLFMEEARGWKQEVLQTVLMNARGEIIAVERVSVGTLSKAEAHPREVFRGAVRRSAAYLILVHNHPSGDPQPSQSDQMITERLVEGGRLLGIEVLDHLILGEGAYCSMKEQQLM